MGNQSVSSSGMNTGTRNNDFHHNFKPEKPIVWEKPERFEIKQLEPTYYRDDQQRLYYYENGQKYYK